MVKPHVTLWGSCLARKSSATECAHLACADMNQSNVLKTQGKGCAFLCHGVVQSLLPCDAAKPFSRHTSEC